MKYALVAAKKSLALLSFVVLVTFAVTLLNCGNDHHSIPGTTSQFAFIQPSAGSGSGMMSAAERHFRTEHPELFRGIRRQPAARGLKPWANTIVSGSDSIVLMNNDGSGTQVIANQAGNFDAVQEGFDGKRGVASAQDDNGTYQILYVDLADKNNPKVTQLTTDTAERWSPQISWDGAKVVHVKYVSGEGGRAILMSTSGGAETEISTTFNVSTPSFTPDGKILFEQEDNDSISIMKADGTGVTQLTNPDHTYFDEYPSVSPDGKTIVFARYPADYSAGEDIWTANIDGTNAEQLTTDGLSTDPMFVKDKIVFISARDSSNSSEVYSMNADGTNQKRLTNDSVSQYFDGW